MDLLGPGRRGKRCKANSEHGNSVHSDLPQLHSTRILKRRVTPQKIALLFVGYGNVARRFVQLLDESRPTLAALQIQPIVVGVVTQRHGRIFDSAGLNMARIADLLQPSRTDESSGTQFIVDSLAALRSADVAARIVVETTTLNIRAGEPAIAHVRAAIEHGADVITANKGPAAFAYRSLADAALRAGRSFLFEGAVMDGIPVFNLLRETMPGVTVTGFRGVVNSTTNYMLTAMEAGEAYGDALARMQEAGVAEADPSLDVDGWDAAAKAAVLANVLLDADTTPLAIAREGIGPDTGARAIQARARGMRLKLVAQGTGRGAAAELRVHLEELPADDPLATLDGQANALELNTWPLGRIVITQRDGGMEKTAYALLTDLVTVVQRLSNPSSNRSIDRS